MGSTIYPKMGLCGPRDLRQKTTINGEILARLPPTPHFQYTHHASNQEFPMLFERYSFHQVPHNTPHTSPDDTCNMYPAWGTARRRTSRHNTTRGEIYQSGDVAAGVAVVDASCFFTGLWVVFCRGSQGRSWIKVHSNGHGGICDQTQDPYEGNRTKERDRARLPIPCALISSKENHQAREQTGKRKQSNHHHNLANILCVRRAVLNGDIFSCTCLRPCKCV